MNRWVNGHHDNKSGLGEFDLGRTGPLRTASAVAPRLRVEIKELRPLLREHPPPGDATRHHVVAAQRMLSACALKSAVNMRTYARGTGAVLAQTAP